MWFAELDADLAPQRAAEELAADLEELLLEIHAQLQEPTLTRYYYQLYPDQSGEAPAEPEGVSAGARARAETLVTAAQLQLMERAFVRLRLDDPRSREHERHAGWMNLFRQWSASSVFKRGYVRHRGIHGGRFRNFCGEVLGLPEVVE